MKATLQRMQERWRLTLWRTVAVLVAFSLAGTSTVLVKAPLIAFLLPPDAQRWVQGTVYLVVMVPMDPLFPRYFFLVLLKFFQTYISIFCCMPVSTSLM